MNSSEVLTSQDAMQGPSLSPCIGQQWPNWMNGLFDTCGPDGTLQSTDSKVTSELSHFDEVATIDPSDLDLFAALPPGGECTDLAVLPSPTDSEGDYFNCSYMEIFTDLNDIMKMAEPEVTVDPVIQMVATEVDVTVQENTITTSTSKRGRKRKAAAATGKTITTGEDHRYSTKRSMPDYIQATTSVSDMSDVVDTTSAAEGDEEAVSPVEKKKMKYKERRQKNNIASQKSRQMRKKKNSALEQEAEDLEMENVAMRTKIAEAEALTKELKELLVTQLAGGKK